MAIAIAPLTPAYAAPIHMTCQGLMTVTQGPEGGVVSVTGGSATFSVSIDVGIVSMEQAYDRLDSHSCERKASFERQNRDPGIFGRGPGKFGCAPSVWRRLDRTFVCTDDSSLPYAGSCC